MKPAILLSRGRWRGVTQQPPAPTPPPAPVEFNGHRIGLDGADGWTTSADLPASSQSWAWTGWYQRLAGPGGAETFFEIAGTGAEYTAIWGGISDGRLLVYINYGDTSIDLGAVAVGEKLFVGVAANAGTMLAVRRPQASSDWVSGTAPIGMPFTPSTFRRGRSGGGEVGRFVVAMERIFSAGLDSLELSAESASAETVATGKTLTPTWAGQSTREPVQFDIRLIGGTPAPAPAPEPPPPDPDPDPDPGEHHFFRSDSPWNIDIPPSATWYGPSDLRTQGIRKTTISGGATAYAVNAQNYAINVFYESPGDDTRTIRVRDIYGPGGVPRYDFYVTVPWPAGSHPAMGSDGHWCCHSLDGITTHEFWYLRTVGGQLEAATYARVRKDGTGWNLFPWSMESSSNPTGRNPAEATAGSGACRAVSVGLLGGLITKEDVDAGVINHALAIALPRAMIKRGPRVPPADPTSSYYDGDSSSTGDVAYSMRFALPASVNISSLGMSEEWEMVANAFKKGGLPVDVGGNGGREWMIYTQYPGAFAFGTALRNRQSIDFPKIVSRLEFVDMT